MTNITNYVPLIQILAAAYVWYWSANAYINRHSGQIVHRIPVVVNTNGAHVPPYINAHSPATAANPFVLVPRGILYTICETIYEQ